MEDDFFGSIYVELETIGDQLGWLQAHEITSPAWLSFLDVLKADRDEAREDGSLSEDEIFDAAISSAMQVAWEGSRTWLLRDLEAKRTDDGEPT